MISSIDSLSKKYLIAKIPSSGFSNILLELEIALSISYISNRTLILSNLDHCHGIIPSQSWESVWDVIDKDAVQQEFDVEFEFGENFRHLTNIKKYLNKIDTDYFHYEEDNQDTLFYNDQDITNFTEFNNFVNDRTTFNISRSEKYLVVDIALGHFFYNLYLEKFQDRNTLKRKINNAIKYKSEYVNIVDTLIKSKYKNYNAIHIRYPWFNRGYPTGSFQPDEINIRHRPDLLYKQVELFYRKDYPLYISTDLIQTSKAYNHNIDPNEYLDPIRKNYHVITVDDLHLSLKETEKIAIDQIACSSADIFYGTYYSTFSKRINIMRGINGLPTYDYMGWDKVQEPWMEIKSPYPWKILNNQWDWYCSSYLHYTFEN